MKIVLSPPTRGLGVTIANTERVIRVAGTPG